MRATAACRPSAIASGLAAACLLAAAGMAGCTKSGDSPGGVVEAFYALRLELRVAGAPDPAELERLAPYLSTELRELLAQARKRRDDDAARAPGDKPSFAEGDLFSSLFEGPTSFQVGADEVTGDVHRVSVQLAHDLRQPVVSWTDKIVVGEEAGRWVVADIEYGGSWEFGNRGSLVSLLKQALTPQTAAGVLGKWVVVGHRIPGISARDATQAQALHGQPIAYAAEAATSGKDVCPNASYKVRNEAAGPYLASGFKADPQKLGLQPGTNLEITEVSCGGVRWTTLGGTLLITPVGRAFAAWDGVFFELQRQ